MWRTKFPTKVGEHCQAIYSVDGQYHDAKIEEINADGEVSVKFKGFRYDCDVEDNVFVNTFGFMPKVFHREFLLVPPKC